MGIHAWSENIHHRQEGEVPREWNYLYPFLYWPGDLKSYHDEFLEPIFFNKAHAPELLPACPNIENFQFDRHDIKKGEPPSYDQLRHWNKGVNCEATIKHSWFDRRNSRIDSEVKFGFEINKLKLSEALPQLMDKILVASDKTEEVMLDEFDADKFTSNRAEANSKAQSNHVDTAFKLAGIPNDYRKEESNVKADVVAETEVKTDLQNDIIEYQNKLMDGSLSHRTKNKFRKTDEK